MYKLMVQSQISDLANEDIRDGYRLTCFFQCTHWVVVSSYKYETSLLFHKAKRHDERKSCLVFAATAKFKLSQTPAWSNVTDCACVTFRNFVVANCNKLSVSVIIRSILQ